MLCLALKMKPGFSNKVVLKLKLPKNHFNKKWAREFLFFIEKSIQKDSGDF